ncbi:hypothetical protein Tco_0412493 [Tanacetum coccineum]
MPYCLERQIRRLDCKPIRCPDQKVRYAVSNWWICRIRKWIRRIGLLDTAYQTYWVQRTRPIGYGVLRSFGTAYWALGYGVSAHWVRCFVHLGYSVSGYSNTAYRLFGYGELAENVFLMVFDQSIIYGVSVDVNTAYSSKSGNGLEFFKVFRYGVCF